jgi:alkylation response protein AidB-like acyl-CoA dehydrogenase
MAKLFASEMAERVCSARQVFGGYGHPGAGRLRLRERFPVERIYRDVRVCQIYEGTSEVQKILIGRALGRPEGRYIAPDREPRHPEPARSQRTPSAAGAGL